MRIANLDNRLVLLRDGGAVDVARASEGRFGPDPQDIYRRWDEFVDWASTDSTAPVSFAQERLGAPVPRPGQIFAIGLNYNEHAAESGFTAPAEPAVFTKFQNSVTGPFATVDLPAGTVDWEVELVVVMGRRAFRVAGDDAWDYVAGVTVGQDLSERVRQSVPPVPQFSLGKSFPGFAPMGPAVVTLDELNDPNDLELGCRIGGETLQQGRTKDMVFSVPTLIARISAVLPLDPGDVIFTGTPSGIGAARNPARFLKPGDTLVSWVEGVGEMRNTLAAGVPFVMHDPA